MQITQASDYGIRAMIYLAKHNNDQEPIKAEDIAVNEAIPMRFLLKLMGPLIKSGLVKSYRGSNGGYAINLPAEKIDLRMIIEAIDGPIYISRCIEDAQLCNRNGTGSCNTHRVMRKIQQDFVQSLEVHTLDQLIG